jgi:hypothetical protein
MLAKSLGGGTFQDGLRRGPRLGSGGLQSWEGRDGWTCTYVRVVDGGLGLVDTAAVRDCLAEVCDCIFWDICVLYCFLLRSS